MLKLAIASTKSAVKNGCNFSGRASRAEYWWGLLGLLLICIAVGLSMVPISYAIRPWPALEGHLAVVFIYVLHPVLFICYSVAFLALGSRRLHDIDLSEKPQWFYLLALLAFPFGILVVAAVWLAILVFYCIRGNEGDNRFGPEPVIKESHHRDWLVPCVIFITLIFWRLWIPFS